MINQDVIFDDIFQCNNGNICICLDRKYFQFIDVPGDGDCFFHSILKSTYLSGFSSSVHELRMYLASRTKMNDANDIILQRIFHYHGVDVFTWLNRITTMRRWANELDMILAAYLLHVNIITVGNYMNGFISNNMQLNLNHISQCNDYHITRSSTIYVYFHIYKNPIARMSDGNHFAYMHPITYIPDQDDSLHSNWSIESSVNEIQINQHDRDLNLYTVPNRQSHSKTDRSKKLKQI